MRLAPSTPLITRGPRALFAGRTLALLGILLVALNLRTAVTAFSPIVGNISADVPLDATVVGVIGMLPPISFSIFGLITPYLTRFIGLEIMLIAALVTMGAGHALRGLADSPVGLVVGSALTFIGLGAANVLTPPAVKKYFPDRVGLLTSLYATLMAFSTLIPPLIAVPLAQTSGWRVALGSWAILAIIALIPWIPLVFTARKRNAADKHNVENAGQHVTGIWRSPLAWALTAVFAISGMNAYAMFAWLPPILTDIAGVTPDQAGALLSLYAAMGIPASIIVPALAARHENAVKWLIYVAVVCFITGYAGLIVLPGSVLWLWICLAGMGPLVFPLSLVLINLRTRTQGGALALSGFMQSIGYALGAIGPLVMGLLNEATGGWTVPLIFLIVTGAITAAVGTVASRHRYVEDELSAR